MTGASQPDNTSPSTWPKTYLGHVVDIRSGSTPSKDEAAFWDGQIPWVSPKDMKVFRVSDSEDHVSEAALRNTSLKYVPSGCVLMVTRGMILDRVVPVAVTTRPVTINQDMKALLPREGIDGVFLAWLLTGLNDSLLARVEEAAHGAKALRSELWKKLPVSIPPISTQRSIAAFLDHKIPSIDELIATKERFASALAELRQTLITEAVMNELPQFRTDVKERRLDHILFEVQRPVNVEPNKSYVEIGVRSHGKGIFHKEPVLGWQLDEKKVFWIQPGDLVFNIVFAWERAVAVAGKDEQGLIGSHRFPCYRPVEGKADVRFLRYLFLSDFGRFLLDQNSPGAAGRNRTLNRRALLKEKVRLPGIEVQKQIADMLDVKTRTIDTLIDSTRKSIDLVSAYRSCVISTLVLGHRTVSEVTCGT